MAVPSTLIQAQIFGGFTQITARAEIYFSDGVTPFNLAPGVDHGSVSVDATRDERRTLSITFNNKDHSLDSYAGNFWFDKVIKAYRGVNTTAGAWETQIGEFTIDEIDDSSFPHLLDVECRDYTAKCMVSKFTANTSFASGTALETVIGALATNAGITKKVLPITGKTLGKTYLFEVETSRWDAMKQLATDFGYEVFFDAAGYLRLQVLPDPTLSPISFSFKTGPGGNISTLKKKRSGARIYNHILVRNGSTDQVPLSAEAINTAPDSPTSVANLGQDRLYTYTSSFFTSLSQMQTVADAFLKIHALEQFTTNIDSIVAAWLEANTVVEVLDPDARASDPTRYLLSSFSLPMGVGLMSSEVRRVVQVS